MNQVSSDITSFIFLLFAPQFNRLIGQILSKTLQTIFYSQPYHKTQMETKSKSTIKHPQPNQLTPPVPQTPILLFKDNLNQEQIQSIYPNSTWNLLASKITWVVNGPGNDRLQQSTAQTIFALIKEASCHFLFLYSISSSKILYQIATIKFNSLRHLKLDGQSMVNSLEVLSFLDTQIINSFAVCYSQVDKVKPFNKLNWPCLEWFNFKGNKMVQFGNWPNRINNNTSSMLVELSGFRQEDFSFLAKLNSFFNVIIIDNEFKPYARMISQSKLLKCLSRNAVKGSVRVQYQCINR